MKCYVAGIDIGSGTTKCIIIDANYKTIARDIRKTSADFESVVTESLNSALSQAKITQDRIAYIATTGLGRYSISFRDIQITDITCVGKAVNKLFSNKVEFVLDIGAQSTRAIRLWKEGKVKEFRTNEKCAAGSGAFLQRVAKYLEVPLETLGDLGMKTQKSRTISSICAVLAESEIINHVSDSVPIEEIVRGVYESLVERAQAQLRRVGLNGSIALVGGVALQKGMIDVCKQKFGINVLVPSEPQMVAAFGAAILGLQRLAKRDKKVA